jgi:NDP-4-keto-2,6-dideoxyhexose 3-C-methyltransferase
MSYTEISKCRVCGNPYLTTVINLGELYACGIFPEEKNHLESLTRGPLDLVRCCQMVDDSCGVLQLRHSYDPDVMFTNNKYGYLSSLNPTMVDHLQDKVRRIIQKVGYNPGDCFVDIGSNDATLLVSYPKQNDIYLIGFDPSGERLRKYYPEHVCLIPEFFSAKAFVDAMGSRKATVVTSIAMFYDLEDPMCFMREVHDILADDGVWVTEQGYMPKMLENVAYDAVCHEHLEYYGLQQIKWMADRVGFRIVDVQMNEINGGSFEVTLDKNYCYRDPRIDVDELIAGEQRCSTLDRHHDFAYDVKRSRDRLRNFLVTAKSGGKLVCGLGASTKGNTLLQYCDVTEELIPCIGEVNSDKFGCFTPGTQIPIIPEQEMLAMKPDYLLVLPWHFRNFFADNPKYAGTPLVFPLPDLTILR